MQENNRTPKKTTLTNSPYYTAALVLLLIVVTVSGVLVAQRQFQIRENVSPTAPESQPSAAEVSNCTLSFKPKEKVTDGTATCLKKEAHTTFLALNSNFSQTNLPYRSYVERGQQLVYRIYVAPETTEGAAQVTVTDPLPPHVSYVANQNNTPGITYDSRLNLVSVTLEQVTEETIIEFMVQVKDDAPTQNPLSWFWNTAYVGDTDQLSSSDQQTRDAQCTTKLVVQP